MSTLHSHHVCHCGDGYICYPCTERAARSAGWSDGPYAVDIDLTELSVDITPGGELVLS